MFGIFSHSFLVVELLSNMKSCIFFKHWHGCTLRSPWQPFQFTSVKINEDKTKITSQDVRKSVDRNFIVTVQCAKHIVTVFGIYNTFLKIFFLFLIYIFMLYCRDQDIIKTRKHRDREKA